MSHRMVNLLLNIYGKVFKVNPGNVSIGKSSIAM